MKQILLKQTSHTPIEVHKEVGLTVDKETLIHSGALWIQNVNEFIEIFEQHMECQCCGEIKIPYDTYKKIACDIFARTRQMGGELIALHNMMCYKTPVTCLVIDSAEAV